MVDHYQAKEINNASYCLYSNFSCTWILQAIEFSTYSCLLKTRLMVCFTLSGSSPNRSLTSSSSVSIIGVKSGDWRSWWHERGWRHHWSLYHQASWKPHSFGHLMLYQLLSISRRFLLQGPVVSPLHSFNWRNIDIFIGGFLRVFQDRDHRMAEFLSLTRVKRLSPPSQIVAVRLGMSSKPRNPLCQTLLSRVISIVQDIGIGSHTQSNRRAVATGPGQARPLLWLEIVENLFSFGWIRAAADERVH